MPSPNNNTNDFSRIDKELRVPGRVMKWVVRPSKNGFRFLHWATSYSKEMLKGTDVAVDSRTVWVDRTSRSTHKSEENGGGDHKENKIRVRIFQPTNSDSGGGVSSQQKGEKQRLPIVIYFHGGGYAFGKPEQCMPIFKELMNTRECVIVAPDYRVSLEAPYPAGFDDCYDTLLWVRAQATASSTEQLLGAGRSDQIFVAGDSGGGGLAVAVALRARDTGDVKIAFQMPLYPMIDDRQCNPSAVNNTMPVWNSNHNRVAWELYLRGLVHGGDVDNDGNDDDIPVYAAPARSKDFSNLPPAATFVGDLDPFLDETKIYVDKLKAAGIPVQFKIFEGCYHGFDSVVPGAEKSKEAICFLMAAYAHAVDSYFAPQKASTSFAEES